MSSKSNTLPNKKPELSESIKVSPQIKTLLEDVKLVETHTSMDSTIRSLLYSRAILKRFYPKGFIEVDKDQIKYMIGE